MINMALKLVHINKPQMATILMTKMEARQEVTKRRHRVTIHTIKTVQKQALTSKPQADTHHTINTEVKLGAIKQVQTEELQAMTSMETRQALLKPILQAEQLNTINTGIKSKVINKKEGSIESLLLVDATIQQ
jgi:hypothetical protein